MAELERHAEGRFNLDDREMLSQARDLAPSRIHRTGCSGVAQFESSKGSSTAMPLGGVIEKSLAAKSSQISRTHGQIKRRYAVVSVTSTGGLGQWVRQPALAADPGGHAGSTAGPGNRRACQRKGRRGRGDDRRDRRRVLQGL
jgi:hypothetical protein